MVYNFRINKVDTRDSKHSASNIFVQKPATPWKWENYKSLESFKR